ncbi:hypothetical protein [Streptomyces sp. NRRL S-31]|uniref:hypothetical protein n=1 Tax=Streptomyces sp. NRRL S-31 TaxID=1463898 RepID=UPI0004C8D674|nr:hypothetical protein [Streptomyces sp. NRRL S-31]
MTGLTENIKRVIGVTMERGEEGFSYAAVQVETRGGIKKTIRIPHYWAEMLRMGIENAVEGMDSDERRASWWESAPGTAERKTELLGAKP